jgi:hypothetical protein
MRFSALLEITELDPEQLGRPLRPLVALFDDVLTSGKHLAIARRRIRERFPDQAIIAVLIARRVGFARRRPPRGERAAGPAACCGAPRE